MEELATERIKALRQRVNQKKRKADALYNQGDFQEALTIFNEINPELCAIARLIREREERE